MSLWLSLQCFLPSCVTCAIKEFPVQCLVTRTLLPQPFSRGLGPHTRKAIKASSVVSGTGHRRQPLPFQPHLRGGTRKVGQQERNRRKNDGERGRAHFLAIVKAAGRRYLGKGEEATEEASRAARTENEAKEQEKIGQRGWQRRSAGACVSSGCKIKIIRSMGDIIARLTLQVLYNISV